MNYQELHPLYRELTVGESIRLVQPDIKYAELSLSWVQRSDIIQYMGGDFSSPTLEGEFKRLEDIIKSTDEYSWMIEVDGQVIGNVCINSIGETSKKFGVRSGNLVILIGSKDFWGKGIATDVCTAVLRWAFDEAGFQKIVARALQENPGSIKTLQKLEFEEVVSDAFDGLIHGKETVWRNFVRTAP